MSTNDFTVNDAMAAAITAGKCSPCEKSKRGVVIFNSKGVISLGYNHPPAPMRCDGSLACRTHCRYLCIHAEEDALQHIIVSSSEERLRVCSNWKGSIGYMDPATPLQMLHLRVVDGAAVPSQGPSCWQCSRSILGTGKISQVWLLLPDGLRSYTPLDFHEQTLANCDMPAIRQEQP